ncbi:hypothetical protein HUT03_04385 [Candidatus Liberibacter africanus]|uniref:Uncharacterized protein n=1 Tax=Candidatus Liberibacter africanus PTSAPSY TaxID=1277257 RepID=A0A0G3I3P4_LIBAF|nr:hypothetical protein [Candidatus Liberibacter africanus]AKK20481.1 hypothetical protein G293_04310 [Candidatus Liberibacter africanus PTSAPSY]QTP64197.1 hypothetical protein HUT03_04385 [Candidatus Liberibacter africanus]
MRRGLLPEADVELVEGWYRTYCLPPDYIVAVDNDPELIFEGNVILSQEKSKDPEHPIINDKSLR